ncbi:MAG: tetratricopeptide repeat protein [Bacteroidota bacterium]|nr:tetratricopeptide repeat protein [Bacteroidota bacterium]
MSKVFFIFFIASVNFLYSQKKKEIKENVTDFYAKTDSLPFFKFERAELDTLIKVLSDYPMVAGAMGIKFKETIGFKVDRKGIINSFQHYKTDLIMPKDKSFINEADEQKMYNSMKRENERVIKLTESLWFSDSLRENQEIIINMAFIPGEIKKDEGKKVIYLSAGLTNTNQMYNIGVRKFAVKKTLLAKIYFESTIKNNPKDIDAYYNLASCFIKLKDNSNACENFKKCLELGDKTVEEQIKKYCN